MGGGLSAMSKTHNFVAVITELQHFLASLNKERGILSECEEVKFGGYWGGVRKR